MLNIGQTCKSMKSLTWPKDTLSIKFPIVPPKRKAKGICRFFSFFAKKNMKIATKNEIIVKSKV